MGWRAVPPASLGTALIAGPVCIQPRMWGYEIEVSHGLSGQCAGRGPRPRARTLVSLRSEVALLSPSTASALASLA